MQLLGIVPRLWQALITGDKRSTIRFGEAEILPGPLTYVHDSDATLCATVNVHRVTRMRLADAAAFLGMAQQWPPEVMLKGMREHYPSITLEDEVQVIEHSSPGGG